MYSASRAYHSALAQVVLPAYFIAPVKIHTQLEKVLLIHVTVANVAFIVLFSTLLLKAAKKRERRQVNFKKIKFRREYRDCIKRNGDKTWM